VRGDLPSGTVTFLFTDVEGSTKLLHELGPEQYADALAEHRRIVREAVNRHGGVEVDTQGDAFFVAFSTAPGALQAAQEALDGLASGRIRVRIGIHTGTAHITEEGYVGDDVHRAARIAAAAYGGQVLVSAATALLVDTDRLRELGEHRLKDFDTAMPLYQLGEGDFPPLKTISNTNLPRPASSFVGRAREVEEIGELLQDGARLLTLTGPGGTGKTRLALEAASELVGEFKAGVFWVGLAALRDPSLVTDTIAFVLGAEDGPQEHIGDREMLLLLDNLEQVVEAAPELAALVEQCPNLRLLVTSRELLRVRGEREYRVLPLAESEAVALFRERSGLAVDDTVADLCRALDNLPLAIELAAARAGVMSPRQIRERLSRRLDLLKGGRDADPRQQTLRATIKWSYELLSDDEQQLFARLAVFRGGCTMEAAEDVAEADLDLLESLVDKSLLRHSDERFWMLETIREYARERLEASGKEEELQRRHASWFVALAEEAEPQLTSSDQVAWLRRLDADTENFRAALAWCRSTRSADTMTRLAASLWRFWFVRGRLSEGAGWLADALELGDGTPSHARAIALRAAGQLAYRRGRYEEARVLNGQALEASAALDDRVGIGRVLNQQADVAEALDELDRAEELWRESAAIGRDAGDALGYAIATANLGSLLLLRGDVDSAIALTEEALDRFREAGNLHATAIALENLGAAAIRQGRYGDAVPLLRESLVLLRELGSRYYATHVLDELAAVLAFSGDATSAAEVMGAVDALLGDTGGSLSPDSKQLRERTLASVRAVLDPEAFDAAHRLGSSRGLETAIDHVLSLTDAWPSLRPPSPFC
jgi:predicted ATPase